MNTIKPIEFVFCVAFANSAAYTTSFILAYHRARSERLSYMKSFSSILLLKITKTTNSVRYYINAFSVYSCYNILYGPYAVILVQKIILVNIMCYISTDKLMYLDSESVFS